MFPLELYLGLTIPSPRPHRPLAGFDLVMMMTMAKIDVQWRCLLASQIAVIPTGRNARLQLTGLSCGIHSNVIITATINITTITKTNINVIITTIITTILKTLVNINIIIISTPSESRKVVNILSKL